ncbi:MAG: aspartate aminotransferase family protein [Acidimicrobiia bacterium]|nr:aspartate aminotransferase family protein [Acidimicrobiia bacterium]
MAADDLRARLQELRAGDIDWRGGHAFSLVYNTGDHEHEELLESVVAAFCHENALNPFVYPSLVQLEHEVVEAAASLVGNPPPAAGCLTSGGTESIFLAVQVARDELFARHPDSGRPAIVTADTAHPAFPKACKYLGVEHVRVPHRQDGRADVDAMAAAADALGDRAALVVASSPCYPYGIIDPVTELAAMAAERDVLCHVDACLGGWLLPFWSRIGEPVPPWHFEVEGVTSLSMDVHKYGYATKGASVLLHRTTDLRMRQLFVYDDWPGGLYGSLTTAGTRSGAPIAAAWAAIHHLGIDGYVRLAEVVRDVTHRFVAGIGAIDGLHLTFPPDLSLFEFAADSASIGAVGDVMDDRGWHLDRQPGGLHLMVSPFHAEVADRFLADLADAVATHGEDRGKAATYGGVA